MATWRERIVAARELGSFTEQDEEEANHWCSCAVGEQRALHQDAIRYFEVTPGVFGAPVDEVLVRLGSGAAWEGFSHWVRHNDPDRAEAILDAIEDRVLQLKRESA